MSSPLKFKNWPADNSTFGRRIRFTLLFILKNFDQNSGRFASTRNTALWPVSRMTYWFGFGLALTMVMIRGFKGSFT